MAASTPERRRRRAGPGPIAAGPCPTLPADRPLQRFIAAHSPRHRAISHPVPAITHPIRALPSAGRVIWNLAPAPAGLGAADMHAILAATDILVVNEIEALMAVHALGGTADFRTAARQLARQGDTVCLVTAGAQGAFFATPDGALHHAPAAPVTPVDTTGAGDTFVGVLASELASFTRLETAVQRACAAASMACLISGAQDGMPTRPQLDAWIAR